ncbi:MAG: PIN domain-containing protein [Nitrospiraceae bacterium]
MFVVDTNVLVYAADEDAPAHARCRELLERWRSQRSAWYTTWGVLYEFLRVATHPRVLRTPWTATTAWTFIHALLGSPALSLLVETDRHAAVAEEVLREVPQFNGNVVYDAHTAILMREHGIRRIYTRDTDFHRFPFLEVIDPLTS